VSPARKPSRARGLPAQTGHYYCSGCGRKFRYTHDGRAICLTQGCRFATKTRYADDYDG
jgi:hypothetical protein